MIEFKDLLEYCQAEAIANRMHRTEASAWRAICRSYSKAFSTPLHLVLEMDAEHVILNVYEDNAEDMDIEDYQRLEHILDMIRTIEDPNYEVIKKNEQEEFDRKAELEEEERLKSGRAVHTSMQKDLNRKKGSDLLPEEPKKPTGGMINLDYLSKQDSEG